MDEQTRLLTEVRDLLAAIRKDNREAVEKSDGWQDRIARYEAMIHRYQYTLGATKSALWIIGAVEVAVVARIITYGSR